jgi:hypothetical protein
MLALSAVRAKGRKAMFGQTGAIEQLVLGSGMNGRQGFYL